MNSHTCQYIQHTITKRRGGGGGGGGGGLKYIINHIKRSEKKVTCFDPTKGLMVTCKGLVS